MAIRKIASGTGYQFIAAGDAMPAGFSPSNHLWIEMAEHAQPHVGGDRADRAQRGRHRDEGRDRRRSCVSSTASSTPRRCCEAVIAGELVMGYTNPFASSTGLNFLLTVLDDFAEGDEARLVAPDVASVFEAFQEQVPFVAFTTLQMRESVEKDNGSLDAFVMEWQTYANTDSLRSGFEFIPFGVRHDNPLYAFDARHAGGARGPGAVRRAPRRATSCSARPRSSDSTRPTTSPTCAIPPGQTLIEAQRLWKDKKDAGRPVYAVFVTDTSGSMAGSRINAVQRALESSRASSSTPRPRSAWSSSAIDARKRLDIAPFDLNQQASFAGRRPGHGSGGRHGHVRRQ